MYPNFTQALAKEKFADMVRAAEQDRRAAAARPEETHKPTKWRRFAPRLRRPAVA